MHNNHIDTCIESEENTFAITVSPNVDYVLVVALMVILYEVNKDRKKKKMKGSKCGGSKDIIEESEDSNEDDQEEDDDTEDSD